MSSIMFYADIKREMAEHMLANPKGGLDGAIAHGLQRAYQLGAENDGATIGLPTIERAVNAMSADDISYVLIMAKRALDARRDAAKASRERLALEAKTEPVASSFLVPAQQEEARTTTFARNTLKWRHVEAQKGGR